MPQAWRVFGLQSYSSTKVSVRTAAPNLSLPSGAWSFQMEPWIRRAIRESPLQLSDVRVPLALPMGELSRSDWEGMNGSSFSFSPNYTVILSGAKRNRRLSRHVLLRPKQKRPRERPYGTKKASCIKQIAEQRFRPNKRNHQSGSSVCVGINLFSRSVARQVSSAPASLTSVFEMGTGGPSP